MATFFEFVRRVGMPVPHYACMDARLLYSKKESAQLLSLSLRTIDGLIQRKELSVRRVGRRILITRKSLEDFARRNA
jgi:excisionase family DNA binding protein